MLFSHEPQLILTKVGVTRLVDLSILKIELLSYRFRFNCFRFNCEGRQNEHLQL